MPKLSRGTPSPCLNRLLGILRGLVELAAIVRVAERVRAACILRNTIVINGTTSVIFREELFDFPISLLGADAKLKIFLRNGIPVLKDLLALIPRRVSSLSRLTLYTIMTARRLQIVAKNNPSR